MQSVISIAGLALGFTAFILAGYWYSWEHSFDTFHDHSNRTYALTTSGILEARGARHADLNQLQEEAKNYIVNLPEVEAYCMIDNVLDCLGFRCSRLGNYRPRTSVAGS